MSEIGDILTQASRVLDVDGWCQDALQDSNTHAVCTFGAINTVVYGTALAYNPLLEMKVSAAGDALYNHLPEPYKVPGDDKRGCVVDYNNAPGRTVTDIKELFAKTIADEGYSP